MNKTGINILRNSVQDSMSAQSRAIDVTKSLNAKDQLSTRRSLASRLQDIAMQSPAQIAPSNTGTSNKDKTNSSNRNVVKSTRNNLN